MLRLSCLPIQRESTDIENEMPKAKLSSNAAIYGDQIESEHRWNYEKVALFIGAFKMIEANIPLLWWRCIHSIILF